MCQLYQRQERWPQSTPSIEPASIACVVYCVRSETESPCGRHGVVRGFKNILVCFARDRFLSETVNKLERNPTLPRMIDANGISKGYTGATPLSPMGTPVGLGVLDLSAAKCAQSLPSHRSSKCTYLPSHATGTFVHLSRRHTRCHVISGGGGGGGRKGALN